MVVMDGHDYRISALFQSPRERMLELEFARITLSPLKKLRALRLNVLGQRPDTNASGSPAGHVVLIPKRLRLCACRSVGPRPQLRTKCATSRIALTQSHIS